MEGTLLEIEWDERKRRQVLKEHDVDLLYAAGIFEGAVVTRVDDRKDYGEVREISLGLVDDECFVVVHTQRGAATRLITAWKGGRDDRSQYQASLARGNRAHEEEG